jgi:large subunit ribosomal protein L6
MSRLGKMPVSIPKGVEVKNGKNGAVHFKGPKGTLDLHLPSGIQLKIEEHEATLERDEKLSPEKALHGLYRSLVKNCIQGVFEGFEIKLDLVGVGYRANVQGSKLDLQLGFSHPTALDIPKTVQVVVDKGVAISIKGIDKKEVGQFAASVRSMKPPEPYKGKGIRYKDEYVRKKEGKAAKGKA